MFTIPNQQIRKVVALTVMLTMTLWLTMSPILNAAQSSQQDKITACNNLADKKGLKGDDRKNFIQNCLNQATDVQRPSDMSTKDKANACKDLADKKNLKGEDRRSFLKDCMNKLNSK